MLPLLRLLLIVIFCCALAHIPVGLWYAATTDLEALTVANERLPLAFNSIVTGSLVALAVVAAAKRNFIVEVFRGLFRAGRY
jgi:hypothetical protein